LTQKSEKDSILRQTEDDERLPKMCDRNLRPGTELYQETCVGKLCHNHNDLEIDDGPRVCQEQVTPRDAYHLSFYGLVVVVLSLGMEIRRGKKRINEKLILCLLVCSFTIFLLQSTQYKKVFHCRDNEEKTSFCVTMITVFITFD
jgi:hypothetical protein